MRTQLVLFSTVLSTICGTSLGDVYVEVDFTGAGPNGQTDGSLVIDGSESLSVYVWADEPGVLIENYGLSLNGLSMQGVLNSGGDYRFLSIGVNDPTGAFFLPISDGMIDASGNMLTDIVAINLLTQATELPTSMDDALVIYEGFTGSALTGGAGVLPELELFDPNFGPIGPIHSYGVYQTPAPGTLGVIAALGLVGSRRRRDV